MARLGLTSFIISAKLHTLCSEAVIKRSNTPLAQLNIWLLKSSGKWNSTPGVELVRGCDVGDWTMLLQCFISLQSTKAFGSIFSLNCHDSCAMQTLSNPTWCGGAENWKSEVTCPDDWPLNSYSLTLHQIWSISARYSTLYATLIPSSFSTRQHWIENVLSRKCDFRFSMKEAIFLFSLFLSFLLTSFYPSSCSHRPMCNSHNLFIPQLLVMKGRDD